MDKLSFKLPGPVREIVCEILRALDALQGDASSMTDKHKRQSESSTDVEEPPTVVLLFDFSLSPIRNKVEIVAGKFSCNDTTKSSVNRPILAIGPS